MNDCFDVDKRSAPEKMQVHMNYCSFFVDSRSVVQYVCQETDTENTIRRVFARSGSYLRDFKVILALAG